MSGGVDSAVAAARMVAAGHDVTGVHLALGRGTPGRERGCCTREDARDAARAADVLGVPFYVWDLSEQFQASVVADFVAEYAAGRTPNPCVRCNETIKFAAVLRRATRLGFEAVCTGHYARVVDGPTGPQLHRAVDMAKDQSYVLGVLTADQLGRSLFPLGDSHKAEVRDEAARLGLAVADKPDSTDICFVGEEGTGGFLDAALGPAPGAIVDEDGQPLGEHAGVHRYTVGQRRGLGVGAPAGDGRPRYVLALDPVARTVVVGPREALAVDELVLDHLRWAGDAPTASVDCDVQVRAHSRPRPARAVPDAAARGNLLRVALRDAEHGVAPGQTAVVYRGTQVLGSGTVVATARRAQPTRVPGPQ